MKLSNDDWGLIGFVEHMIGISIFLGFLTNIIIKVEKEIITNVSGTIAVAMVSFTALIVILFVFKLEILLIIKEAVVLEKGDF